jgi:hypothetical protein
MTVPSELGHLLTQYHNGQYQLWSFLVSHGVAWIRLSIGAPLDLFVMCEDTISIEGNVSGTFKKFRIIGDSPTLTFEGPLRVTCARLAAEESDWQTFEPHI